MMNNQYNSNGASEEIRNPNTIHPLLLESVVDGEKGEVEQIMIEQGKIDTIDFWDGQTFLYQRRAVVDGRDWWQTIMGKWLYPWQYCCINNSIKKEKSLGLFDSSLRNLAVRLDEKLETDKNEKRVIIVKPNHERLFYSDGAHSDVWAIYEKGVKQDIAEKFCKYLGDDWSVKNLD